MLTVLKRLWKHGSGTSSKEMLSLPTTQGRGKPVLDPHLCDGCGDCAAECPTEAISLKSENDQSVLVLNYTSCISCTICSDVCPTAAFTISNELLTPVTNLNELNQEYPIKRSSERKGDVCFGELAETFARGN
jgi:hydrogenase-4 component H